jgi:hypothetical protein
MALDLKLYITEDFNTGETVRIDDITGLYSATNTGGYGTPNPTKSQITKIRFIFSSYVTENTIDSNVTECLSGKEYVVQGSGANTVVVNTKTYSLGDTFILMVDATPVIGVGLTLAETGRFAYTSSFLPADNYIELVPSTFGLSELIFPDSSYIIVYELYTTSVAAGSGKAAGTYIVSGTTGTSTIAGVVYNAGEVFTQSSTFTFTGNNIILFNEDVTYNFPLYYNALAARNAIANQYAQKNCQCKEELGYKLFQIDSRLEAIRYNFEDTLNTDYSGTQTLLEQIIEIQTENINC